MEGAYTPFVKSDNKHKCPFCNSHRGDKTDEEDFEDTIIR